MDRPRTSPNPRPTLDEAVNAIAELRPLGAVATQILSITEGDQFCAQELAKVVSADQALSAKMLRLSNSPYYGFPRRITTVRDAIVLLGFRAVRSATISSCVIRRRPRRVPEPRLGDLLAVLRCGRLAL